MTYNTEILSVDDIYIPLLRIELAILFSIDEINGVKLTESIELAGITFVIVVNDELAGWDIFTVVG